MKTSLLKSFFSASLSVVASIAFASSANEILVTTMQGGGDNGMGVIYSINPDGSQGGITLSFNGTNGANPTGNLVEAANRLIYGTTSAGGSNNYGVLFSLNPETNDQRVVHHFNKADGWAPKNIHLVNNIIYGTTHIGGTHTGVYSTDGMGVMYSYNINTQTFSKLIDFDSVTGENPQSIILGIDSNLYGLTRQGGEHGYGVIYRFIPNSSTYSRLHSFDDAGGSLPTNSKLIQASDRKLYGTTTWGGNYNMGVLFSLDMAHDVYTVLYHFNGATGSYPSGVLTEANGILYGVTPYGGTTGGGVVYGYNMSTGTYTVVHNFEDATGRTPVDGVTLGANGQLYGLTTNGGDNLKGVIYTITPGSNTYTVIGNNSDATGNNPNSTLLELTEEVGTGLNESEQSAVSLYPNPTNNYINFNISNYTATDITITDLNGSKVFHGSYTTKVDISQLTAGSYFVTLSGDHNTPVVRTRIVKQ